MSEGDTLLVRSEPGEATECLRRNDTQLGNWLHESPRRGTTAYDLLHGARESPRKGAGATTSGATAVGSEGWLRIPAAWWCPASEDSLLTEDGKVLSLLSWLGDAMAEMCARSIHRRSCATPPGAAMALAIGLGGTLKGRQSTSS